MEEKIKEILKSGDFTIVYWDRNDPTLYKKKFEIYEEFERDEYETINKYIVDMPDRGSGYVPSIVSLLASALGGETDSI